MKFVDSSNILKPAAFYATDRSKAVVPMLFVFYLAVWLILRGASSFKVFPYPLSSCCFISFSIVIISIGKEGAGLCASRTFVCLFCTISLLCAILYLRFYLWLLVNEFCSPFHEAVL